MIDGIIKWGIIGCGAVTEKKNGPAFNKVPNSSLVAVMRRDAEKAADYAKRHGVSPCYSDAEKLIADPEVNAIYIATPPDSHEHYTRLALEAGKPVYVEKPMAHNVASAEITQQLAAQFNDRVVVAHYRRNWPKYKKVKQLLDDGKIGKPFSANLQYFRVPLTAEEMLQPGVQWRINPAISGGGLFHDLAPHQLDLFLYWFGDVFHAAGNSMNVGGLYDAPDMVSGTLAFENGVRFTGEWCFCAQDNHQKDQWEIVGEKGRISGSVFWEADIQLENENGLQTFSFEAAEHNQIYHIEEVVKFFRGEAPNPCSTMDGLKVMQWMDAFSGI